MQLINKIRSWYRTVRLTDWIIMTFGFIMICQISVLTCLSIAIVKSEQTILEWKTVHVENNRLLKENHQVLSELKKSNTELKSSIRSCMACHGHPAIMVKKWTKK